VRQGRQSYLSGGRLASCSAFVGSVDCAGHFTESQKAGSASESAIISMRTRESVERRKHYRYRLRVPLMFFWRNV
jgi:hypothetical protein